jgi:predicted flavoprotein YhiN
MDELFTMIGRLYADLHNSQKIIDLLQDQIKNKDQEILELKKLKLNNE